MAGGNDNNYFVDNIIHFHLTQSVFDLVLMSATKLISMVLLYTYLEDATMQVQEFPFERATVRRKAATHLAIYVLSLVYFAYPVVKGGLVLNALLNDTSYPGNQCFIYNTN